MDIVKIYSNMMKKHHKKSNLISNMIKLGLYYEYLNKKFFYNKNNVPALNDLNKISIQYILKALKNPNETAWVNLFSPSEILHAFELHPLFIESFSSFLAGFKIQDLYIEAANSCGMADSLCSYHKAFIGAVEADLLKKPIYALTSSSICDANIGTFAYLSKKLSIPYFVMDIPHKKNEKAVCYVVNQLNEMIHQLENITRNRFNHDRLKAILSIENQTIEYRKKVLKLMTEKDLSITMTHEMYMMNAAHVFMGTEEILKFYTSLYHDLTKARPRHKKRILWVHTLPFPFEPFKKYFNHNDDVEIIGMELNYPKLKVLDETRPLDALADKMIDNVYNGPYIKKINHVIEMAQTLKVDGIVHFCHWGCRQNAGGTALLKKACQEVELPFLSLDGDGIDMRNNQQGQMITRMDAFLEMVDRW